MVHCRTSQPCLISGCQARLEVIDQQKRVADYWMAINSTMKCSVAFGGIFGGLPRSP